MMPSQSPDPGKPEETPRPEHQHAATPAERAWENVVIPGTPEELTEEIAAASPEGRPADPKGGPAAMWGWVVFNIMIIVIAVGASAIWLGWGPASVVGVISVLSLAFNPAVGAALARARERREVLKHHQP
jgi:hypothetical protein